MLSQWDLAIDAKITFGKNILGHNDKKRLRRDSLWVANNHSIAIIGVLSAPIALLFMVLVSLFLGHKITVCYIVLILFCLSLYIMSISKYDHCYFEYFESIRDINIKKWRYQCLMFAIADMIVGAVLVCILIHIWAHIKIWGRFLCQQKHPENFWKIILVVKILAKRIETKTIWYKRNLLMLTAIIRSTCGYSSAL